jgi:hypothetical protein
MSIFFTITKSVFGTGTIAESSISPFNPALAKRVPNFLESSLQFHPNNLVWSVSR